MSSPHLFRSSAIRRSTRSPLSLPGMPQSSRDEPVVLQLMTFEVTEEPISDPSMRKLSRAGRARIEEAGERVLEGAVDLVPVLERLVEEFPNLPKVYNYLSIACLNAGQDQQAVEWTEKCYRRFPRYLFAIVNHAHNLLAQGSIEDVTKILAGRFSLHLWVNNRRRYHVSEFVAFNGLMVRYFAALGESDLAQTYMNLLLEVAPTHPGTRQVAPFAGRGLIRSFIRRLAGLASRD